MNDLPRLRIAHLPTPVEDLPRLSSHLGGPSIYIKRDDQTGLAFGGNKTRKLEYIIAEAQATGARTLITTGAEQSNHCRQTAAAAARLGFDCILVLTSRGNQTITPPVSGNLLLDRLLGADIVWAPHIRRDQVLADTFEIALAAGRRPFLIPYGASSPLGAAAYAFALKELIDQTQIECVLSRQPDWIVFASSSGGTQAGLVLGARLFGFKGSILGISVDEDAGVLRDRIVTLANAAGELLGENVDYLGEGYGVLGEVEKDAINLFARTEGLMLDPVYTSRAAAGLIDLIRHGFFSREGVENVDVLFWHTGGTPALFAEKYRDVV
jgi:D-cysteine desulfhydrase family pyridoxal phosphate-dependent enzyme